MTDLRTAAQQALEALEDFRFAAGFDRPLAQDAIDALRAALAQQDEPVTKDTKSAVRLAPSSAYWSQQLRGLFGPDAREGIDTLERRLAEAQQAEPKGGGNLPPPLPAEPVQEPDLSRCPQCNGPADNGHDRSLPPNPYLCTKCMAEMPQPSYNVTVVDDAHPNGIPLEQWIRQNRPVQRPQTLDEAMQQPRAMAQAYEAGYNAGVAHEREACAQVCEARFMGDLNREDMEARRCAAAIRARGVQS